MPTNSTNFSIPKPVASDAFNLTNFNAVLDAIDTNVKTALDAKETPAGAQTKATTAETNAKAYADTKVTKYGAATGSANAYAVTLSPAPTSYTDGMAVSVKINVDSTGASTLNVNGLGAKALKKSNGSDITNLKTNGIYTFRYNSTNGNFIVQGEGGSGNATAADIVAGKTASTDAGDVVGTATITSLGGMNYQTGTVTSGSSTSTFQYIDNGTKPNYFVSVTGLTFKPTFVYIVGYNTPNSMTTIYEEIPGQGYPKTVKMASPFSTNITNSGANLHFKGDASAASVTSTGFTLPVQNPSTNYTWIAFG